MKHCAHGRAEMMETFEQAIDYERAVDRYRLDDSQAVVASGRLDASFDGLGAYREKLECRLDYRHAAIRGDALVTVLAREQAFGERGDAPGGVGRKIFID
jgi:hypothetical protein